MYAARDALLFFRVELNLTSSPKAFAPFATRFRRLPHGRVPWRTVGFGSSFFLRAESPEISGGLSSHPHASALADLGDPSHRALASLSYAAGVSAPSLTKSFRVGTRYEQAIALRVESHVGTCFEPRKHSFEGRAETSLRAPRQP